MLLFDEDPARADEIGRRLEGEGFTVSLAHNFVEAVAHLSPPASLMLVYLPATDFVRNTFLAEAREAAPAMPVVALAAQPDEPLRAVLSRFGVRTVLPSAAQWSDVMDAIRNALETKS